MAFFNILHIRQVMNQRNQGKFGSLVSTTAAVGERDQVG